MRPRPRPERVRPRLRPNDLASRPRGPGGLNIPGWSTNGRRGRNGGGRGMGSAFTHVRSPPTYKQMLHLCPVPLMCVLWGCCVSALYLF